jgi:AraC family transcriptional regulator
MEASRRNLHLVHPRTPLLERVLRHVAAHLDQPLSVASLADVAGLSPFHFARLFTALVGESPMSHVRRRRMQLAVRRLSEGAPPDLVQLAFECGFDSQEAFTRAFKASLGVTPGRFKRNTAAIREMMAMPMIPADAPQGNLAILDGVRTRAAFKVAGATLPLDRDSAARIPEVWRDLLRRLPLPGQLGGEGYGVCWTGDAESGGMTYLAGFAVAAGAKLPPDLATLDIPAQNYRIFRLTLDGSSLHPQMQAAMREIFESRIPEAGWELSGGPDLEIYEADFNPTQKGGTVEFWVPVKG